MPSTVTAVEFVGPPPGSTRATEFLHLLGVDGFSTGELGFARHPILPRLDGGPVYSMERWLRFRFAQPFTEVFDFKFWMPGLAIPQGWTLNYGVARTYRTPSNGPSEIATGPVPTTKPQEPNVGGVPPLQGNQEQHSDWVVLQVIVNGDAPVGPMQGFTGNNPKPLQFRFDWTEV